MKPNPKKFYHTKKIFAPVVILAFGLLVAATVFALQGAIVNKSVSIEAAVVDGTLSHFPDAEGTPELWRPVDWTPDDLDWEPGPSFGAGDDHGKFAAQLADAFSYDPASGMFLELVRLDPDEEALNVGDVFFTRLVFHNESTVPVYGRFRFADIPDHESNVKAAYAVWVYPAEQEAFDPSSWSGSCLYSFHTTSMYNPASEDDEDEPQYRHEDAGWFYALNPLMPGTAPTPEETQIRGTDYVVWIAGYIMDKEESDVELGVPAFDLIQADGEAAYAEDGWNAPRDTIPFLPTLSLAP